MQMSVFIVLPALFYLNWRLLRSNRTAARGYFIAASLTMAFTIICFVRANLGIACLLANIDGLPSVAFSGFLEGTGPAGTLGIFAAAIIEFIREGHERKPIVLGCGEHIAAMSRLLSARRKYIASAHLCTAITCLSMVSWACVCHQLSHVLRMW